MNEILSANLKNLRQAKQLTQESVGECLNVSAQTVSRRECGTTFPDVTLLPQIAEFYGVTIDDLFRKRAVAYENYAQRLSSIYEASRETADFLRVEQEFKKLIARQEYSAEDLRTFGIMYQFMMMDCREKALYWLERALQECTAEDSTVRRRIIEQQMRLGALLGKAEEAVVRQKEVLEQDPGQAENWVLLVVALIHAKRYEDAYARVTQAIEKFPEEWELYIHAGDVYGFLGKFQEALAFAEKALKMRPDYVDAKYTKACCFAKMRRIEDAYHMHMEIAEDLRRDGLDVEADAEVQRAKNLMEAES